MKKIYLTIVILVISLYSCNSPVRSHVVTYTLTGSGNFANITVIMTNSSNGSEDIFSITSLPYSKTYTITSGANGVYVGFGFSSIITNGDATLTGSLSIDGITVDTENSTSNSYCIGSIVYYLD